MPTAATAVFCFAWCHDRSRSIEGIYSSSSHTPSLAQSKPTPHFALFFLQFALVLADRRGSMLFVPRMNGIFRTFCALWRVPVYLTHFLNNVFVRSRRSSVSYVQNYAPDSTRGRESLICYNTLYVCMLCPSFLHIIGKIPSTYYSIEHARSKYVPVVK